MGKREKRKIFTRFFTILGVLLIVGGSFLAFLYFTKPQLAEKIVYTAKNVVIDKPAKTFKEDVLEEYPTIHFNGHGGSYELDVANKGDWIHLDSYDNVTTILPVWALHSTFGGAEILNWNKGQKFHVVGDGYDGDYVVVDTRDVYKYGLVNQIEGMQGDFALQTCHFGEDLIKFVSAVPLSVYEAGWPPEPQQSSEQQSGETDKIVEIELEGNQHDENL